MVVALWRGGCDWVHGGAGHAGLNGDGELELTGSGSTGDAAADS